MVLFLHLYAVASKLGDLCPILVLVMSTHGQHEPFLDFTNIHKWMTKSTFGMLLLLFMYFLFQIRIVMRIYKCNERIQICNEMILKMENVN